ncbi:hypothetical protein N7467_006902 [Penicillium canescens]|nr:hypothetical protein N7467_006902 [Penicillium canescens]
MEHDQGVSFRIQGKWTDWYFRGALGDSGCPVSTGNVVFGCPEVRSGASTTSAASAAAAS